MIVVHHLNNSRSQRVLWLLEELGVPYEVKRYERDAATMLAPSSLRAVHALGKSPVVTDGDLTLAESGAIVEYLAGRYGNGRLVPAPDTLLTMHEVSSDVNNVRNKDAALIAAHESMAQGTLLE